MNEEQLAAVMWFNIAGFDKGYSLSECVQVFQQVHKHTRDFWIQKARRYLAEATQTGS